MMKARTTTAVFTLCLVLGCAGSLLAQQPSPLAPEQPQVQITLNDAIGLAFQRNLDLKVELYNPALAEADINRSLGIYDPLLTASLGYNRTTSPNTLDFSPLTLDQYSASASVSQLLPTGGTIGATGNSGWLSNSLSYYSNTVNFTASQPLLRNFGRDTTELSIAVSRVAKEGSIERFKTRLSDTVAQVRNDYFQLYNLREALEVKKSSLALARRILDETRGRVKAGVLPAMEILNAEFGAATQEKAVIDAERAVRDQMDVLRLELQLGSAGDIVLLDQPTTQSYTVVEEQQLALAIASRPELAAQRSTVRIDDLQQRVAKNRTLPDLTVNANFGLGGYDPRYPKSLEKTANGSDPNWGVGLQFSYPLGNRAAENDYIKSRLTSEQARTQLQSLEAGIAKDVKTSIRLLNASYKQLDVTARGRAYAEDRMRAFEKKNAVGLATTKDVIDALNDLVAAKGNQIQAVVDYNNAITQVWHVSGELLERQGIKVTERQADPLYQREK